MIHLVSYIIIKLFRGDMDGRWMENRSIVENRWEI
jgi:hypothetical protein